MHMDDWPVSLNIDVRWGELDALGHVNNTVYFRWFEDVRIRIFQNLEISMDTNGVGPILASTTCDFGHPVTFPASLDVSGRIASIGTTSFVMEYIVHDASRVYAQGRGVIVMLDYKSGEKVKHGEELRRRLETMMCGGDRIGSSS